MFDEWRGIRNFKKITNRIDLVESSCACSLSKLISGHFIKEPESVPGSITYSPPNCTSPALPSKRLDVLLDKTMDHFNLTRTKYIAVMIRTQKIKNLKADKQNPSLRAIVSDWESVKDDYNISRTFLITDIGGKHGSLQWKQSSAISFSERIRKELDTNFTPDQMDSALEAITGSKDSVQIALLQRLIVARATCVVLAGGGTFQSQTLNSYLIAHKGHECYRYRSNSDLIYVKNIYGF